jgi:hypothetical protein
VSYVQVQDAVSGYVTPCCTAAPGLVSKATGDGRFFESAVTQIVKQPKSTIASDKGVSESIIVEIGGRNTVTINRRLRYAGAISDVFKVPVVRIPKKPVRQPDWLHIFIECTAARQPYVVKSISIDVQNAYSTAKRLNDSKVSGLFAVPVGKDESRVDGDVFKKNIAWEI